MKVLIDSNIPMYVAGAGHPNRDPARLFLRRVQSGELEACTSTEVLQEIIYRYSRLGRLDLARPVYDSFAEVCPVVIGITLAGTDRARELICSTQGISARDAVHGATMLNHEVGWIATFDTGFDQAPGVRRIELNSAPGGAA